METCPMCGGEAAMLGGLGQRIIWQCRDCGWEWGTAANEESVEEEGD